jgi:hypothetical protein
MALLLLLICLGVVTLVATGFLLKVNPVYTMRVCLVGILFGTESWNHSSQHLLLSVIIDNLLIINLEKDRGQ